MAVVRGTGAARACIAAALLVLAGCGPCGEALAANAGLAKAAAPACEQGAWDGKVGATAARMEFAAPFGDKVAGRSYYRASLDDLLLERDGDGWVELAVGGDARPARRTGRLTLRCAGTTMSGERRSPDGAKTAPVVLHRIGERDYHARRLVALRPPAAASAAPPTAAFRPTPLAVPGLAGVSGLQINLGDRRFERLNAILWKGFVARVEEAVECRGQGLLERGAGHNFAIESRQRLLLAGREFVVVGSAGVYDCGGAHATGLDGAATYRIADGGLVDPGRWFVADAFAAGLEARVRSEHEKLRGEDCAAETSFDPARAWPGSRGMVFAASVGRHASMTCRVDVVLPYATIRSYLSDEGRAAVADFEESR